MAVVSQIQNESSCRVLNSLQQFKVLTVLDQLAPNYSKPHRAASLAVCFVIVSSESRRTLEVIHNVGRVYHGSASDSQ